MLSAISLISINYFISDEHTELVVFGVTKDTSIGILNGLYRIWIANLQ